MNTPTTTYEVELLQGGHVVGRRTFASRRDAETFRVLALHEAHGQSARRSASRLRRAGSGALAGVAVVGLLALAVAKGNTPLPRGALPNATGTRR